MRETKTAKGGADCPTLLHYVARVLLRHDPLLVTFVEDVPHVEAAARGSFFTHRRRHSLLSIILAVSVQTMFTSVNTLSASLAQVHSEIRTLSNGRASSPEDRFVKVMQVNLPSTSNQFSSH